MRITTHFRISIARLLFMNRLMASRYVDTYNCMRDLIYVWCHTPLAPSTVILCTRHLAILLAYSLQLIIEKPNWAQTNRPRENLASCMEMNNDPESLCSPKNQSNRGQWPNKLIPAGLNDPTFQVHWIPGPYTCLDQGERQWSQPGIMGANILFPPPLSLPTPRERLRLNWGREKLGESQTKVFLYFFTARKNNERIGWDAYAASKNVAFAFIKSRKMI